MSNDNESDVQRLFNECKKRNPDLNKTNEYIDICRCKNVYIKTLFPYDSSAKAIVSIMHVACHLGHHEIVERLLDSSNNFQYSVDVNLKSGCHYHRTALHYACNRNRTLTVRALLQHPNIKVNKVDRFYSTSLHHACSGNHKSVVIELLKHPNIQLTVKNRYGDIPLHYACRYEEDIDIIQILLDHQQQKYRIVQLNAINNKHETPLHVACSKQNCAAIVEILKYATVVDINATDRHGKTPLCIACSFDINSKAVRIIKNLLEQPSNMIHKKDINGETPLIIIQEIMNSSSLYLRKQKQCLNEIFQLFKDYNFRQRWLLYCYLMKMDLTITKNAKQNEN